MNIRVVVTGNLLYMFSKMVQKTCRFQVSGMEHFRKLEDEGISILVACWHGLTLTMSSFFEDKADPAKYAIPMSGDWRGRTVKIFAEKLNLETVPLDFDDDASISVARQVLNIVKWVKGGKGMFINPDGPSGPAFQVKPGVVFIAKKAKAAILPVGGYMRHGYRVARWDQYALPYPFSRVSINIGKPLFVSSDEKDMDGMVEEMTNRLNRANAQAAANYYAGA